MDKTNALPIGVTNAEMRVYAEYLEEKIYILDQIDKLEEEKEEMSRSIIKSTSIIRLPNKKAYKDYFRDYMSTFILKREVIDKEINALRTMIDIRTEFCARIEERLDRLGTDDRRLLDLRYLDKLTLEQIAEKIHSNRQSVNDRLNKILKFQLS